MNKEEYYRNTRKDILPLLPEKIDRVLDVGCGAGSTLAWLKSMKGCICTIGIEPFPDAAAAARKTTDVVYEGDIEDITVPIECGSLDLVLCLDVLEHLVDPWTVARRLQELLKPGGALIVSLPNVRNKRVVFPLLFRGKWDYRDFGVLDRTHLRFFVRETAIALVESAGLQVDKIDVTGGFTRGWQGKFLKKVLPGGIQSFFVRQYIIRGIKKQPEKAEQA
jgi:2-polyprenyl-3-methyl-5-hydroxy-6-metoxy-1,4-benzoquinol methylase